MRIGPDAPLELVALTLCGQPAMLHFRASPGSSDLELAGCARCAQIKRALAAQRNRRVAGAPFPAPQPPPR